MGLHKLTFNCRNYKKLLNFSKLVILAKFRPYLAKSHFLPWPNKDRQDKTVKMDSAKKEFVKK